MRNLDVTRAASCAAALVAIALAPFTARARTAAALREQIRRLDRKLGVLERNIELKDETAVGDAKKRPKITIPDGKFEVAPPTEPAPAQIPPPAPSYRTTSRPSRPASRSPSKTDRNVSRIILQP